MMEGEDAVKHPSLPEFLQNLGYRNTRRGGGPRTVGVEREFFLYNEGRPSPRSQAFLERMAIRTDNGAAWTYELSHCQVEHRTGVHTDLDNLRKDLEQGSQEARLIAGSMSHQVRGIELAPEDMSLEVYPEPRYREIAQMLGEDRLRAACRVAGVHVHVGCYNIEDAVNVYGALREALRDLAKLGDHSEGERLRLYGKVVNNLHFPPVVDNLEHLYERACQAGWGLDLRSCWWMLRFSRHGTVEARVFGATDSVDEVLGYVSAVLDVIR